MCRHRIASHLVVVLALVVTSACARAVSGPPRPAAAVPPDELAPLLRAHFGLGPVTVDVWPGRRISVALTHAPWADSSAAVQFDRAYDVACLLWDRYGAASGVDTISVRRTGTDARAAPQQVAEYFFYPRQLTARERPRLGHRR